MMKNLYVGLYASFTPEKMLMCYNLNKSFPLFPRMPFDFGEFKTVSGSGCSVPEVNMHRIFLSVFLTIYLRKKTVQKETLYSTIQLTV